MADDRTRVVLSYGGGTNSTAILVGLWEKHEPLHAITFADTGGEKPHTYTYIEQVSAWCRERGLPEVEILRNDPRWWAPQMLADGSLEAECLRREELPSKAYGYGKCSMKWKVQPQIKWARAYAEAQGVTPEDLVRLIGFDADEISRRDRMIRIRETTRDQEPWQVRFPLFEWGWSREDCVEAIARAGLPLPGKSACWFCPSARKREILELRQRYPELLDRALAIERTAMESVKWQEGGTAGLGRRLNWGVWLREVDAAPTFDFDACDIGGPEIDCGCYDGE